MSIFSPTSSTLPSHSPISSPCFSRFVTTSFGRRIRRRSRRHNKLKPSIPTTTTTTTSFEPKLEAVIDLTIFPSFHSNIRQFVSSGEAAYRDLQTLFTLDENHRVVVSCRPSTIHFVGTSAALTLVAFSIFRVLIELVSRLAPWRRNASGYGKSMVRRDRSLGGKKVVVGLGSRSGVTAPIKRSLKNNKVAVQRKFPKWWPIVNNPNHSDFDFDLNEQEEYRRDAYRLVRAIIDSRMAAKDISEGDIIQNLYPTTVKSAML
ncbi:uncharacterized protein LOC127129975 [Lathyrus oleraceus]|uniref:uncharacterized protein LOC127129975 n=1 Tax=Pisum sativum TaxID=3888 RepID=UPI0021CE6465|nr:uncharacterized protein LOC127129975 [Pisum sativum]